MYIDKTGVMEFNRDVSKFLVLKQREVSRKNNLILFVLSDRFGIERIL